MYPFIISLLVDTGCVYITARDKEGYPHNISDETFLISTHDICGHGEIRKKSFSNE